MLRFVAYKTYSERGENMKDHLVKIDPENLKSLRELYEKAGSKYYITYLTIKNYLNWFVQHSEVKNVDFYSLNGDISDGTFVVIDRYVAYPDTLNKDQTNLLHLLKLLDFSNGFVFYGTRSQIQPSIVAAIEFAGAELECNDFNYLYRCSKEQALEFNDNPPNGINLQPLNHQSDVEKVNAAWPHRTPYSLKYFERLVKYNLSVGACTDDGTLISWALQDPIGMIGALQTDENYFGCGYAKLVTKCLSKSIAESGDDVYAAIYEDNFASRKLFTGLGFEIVGEVNVIQTKFDWISNDE